MIDVDWAKTSESLTSFGGEDVVLRVPKTGLPFFDTLQLYGTIFLFVGLNPEIAISDEGIRWSITARRRRNFVKGRDSAHFSRLTVKPKCRFDAISFCDALTHFLQRDDFQLETAVDSWHQANASFGDMDSALQSGVRGTAAASYKTIESGSQKNECIGSVRFSHGFLASAWRDYVENTDGFLFLPVFRGFVDLSKLIVPLRLRSTGPNGLCTQALHLLALRTALFVEGYDAALECVVYNKSVQQGKVSHSGIISIRSTAIGRLRSAAFVAHLYRFFRGVIVRGWSRKGRDYKAEAYATDAIGIAHWLMTPSNQALSSLITSQERFFRDGMQHAFGRNNDYVMEILSVTNERVEFDVATVRLLAKAVASAIQWVSGRSQSGNWRTPEEQRKSWYDTVTLLRSSSSPRVFLDRVLILLEQGHKANWAIGTVHRGEAFDPGALLQQMLGGVNQRSFVCFLQLFRMCLIQESTYPTKVGGGDDLGSDEAADGEQCDAPATEGGDQ